MIFGDHTIFPFDVAQSIASFSLRNSPETGSGFHTSSRLQILAIAGIERQLSSG